MEKVCNANRNKISNELYLRLAHNQNEINTAKNTIEKFINTKYDSSHFQILTKLIRHCNQLSPEELANQENLVIPDEVSNLNVLDKLDKCKVKPPSEHPRLMTEKENKQYRLLCDDVPPVRHDSGLN